VTEGSEAVKNITETLASISPVVETREILLGPSGLQRTYRQRPLSYMGKLELVGLLGRMMVKARQEGVSFDDVFDVIENTGETSSDVDRVLGVAGHLLTYAPELIRELYALALGVPRDERQLFFDLLDLHPDEGGLSDDEGFAVLETFVAQNMDVLKTFFVERIQPMIERVRGITPQQENRESRRSTRSKRTQPRMARQ